MTPEVSGFIPCLSEDTDKHIEVAEKHHVTAKQKGQIQIQICDNNGYPFIATLHNVILASDLYNRFSSVTALMNLGQTCFFHKWFPLCTLEQKRKIRLHCHIVPKGNMYFWGNKINVKDKEITI